MHCERIFCCLLSCLFSPLSVCAEGLVQNLAEDGSAAVYDFKQEGEIAGPGESTTISATGVARVVLVGTQTVAGLRCRWVELEIDREVTLRKEQRSQLFFCKFLVPENDLTESGDPLGRAIKIFSMRSPLDDEPRLITSKEDRRLALWSLRDYFPRSPTTQNRLNVLLSSQQVETAAGEFECEVHAFDSFVDQYLLGPSRIQECRINRIWKNPTSPFGVVAMNVHSESQQVSIPATRFAGASDRMTRSSVSIVTELRLRTIEESATSRFPHHK
jgi:hypothetical protein